MPAQLLRLLEQDDIVCPAGRVVGDATCHCLIEDSLIDGHLNPQTIENFCMGRDALGGNYRNCPTWRAEKEMLWTTGKGIDLKKDEPDREGVEVIHTEKVVDSERPFVDATVGDAE